MIKVSPFKSMAQMKLFFAKEKRGEMPKGTAIKWVEETPNIKSLPEHVKNAELSDLFIKIAKKLFNPQKSPPLKARVVQQDMISTTKEEKMKGMTPVEYRNEVTARNAGILKRNRKTSHVQF